MSKEKGILFKGEMVRAILEGTKTQTRRLLKYDQVIEGTPILDKTWGWITRIPTGDNSTGPRWEVTQQFKVPWKVGDTLYVRESFWSFGRWEKIIPHEGHFEGDMYWKKLSDKVEFVADYETEPPHPVEGKIMVGGIWRKMPSLHLPKKDSRIWLKVTNVRIERLLDIPPADAVAEGIESRYDGTQWRNYHKYGGWLSASGETPVDYLIISSYLSLWDKINGAGSHKSNPYVVVIEFERVDKPQ